MNIIINIKSVNFMPRLMYFKKCMKLKYYSGMSACGVQVALS